MLILTPYFSVLGGSHIIHVESLFHAPYPQAPVEVEQKSAAAACKSLNIRTHQSTQKGKRSFISLIF